MRALVSVGVVVLAGCTDGMAPDLMPVMPTEVTLRVRAFAAEPTERPVPEPAPVVYIDGEATTERAWTYPTAEDVIASVHVLELRVGEAVIARRDIEDLGPAVRAAEVHVGALVDATLAYCAFASGDLRYGLDHLVGSMGQSTGDGFCLPACLPLGTDCGAGLRCTSRVVSTAPFASRLGCAPVGPKRLGESCTLIADPDGAYDDCGGGLLCVEGACRAVCTDGAYVPGHAPELRRCP